MGLRNMVMSVMALAFAAPKLHQTVKDISILTDPNSVLSPPQRGRGMGKQPYMLYNRKLSRGSSKKPLNSRDQQRKCGRGY